MIVTETFIAGVFILDLELFEDERGFFGQAWSERELEALKVESRFVEGNISFNKKRGTLRGMHYQAAPYEQAKLVRCTQGSIYDVAVDLRPTSPTFGKWVGVELSQENRRMIYLPGDFGHGYLTLEEDTEVHYQVSRVYVPESSRGFRWNDPTFKIAWPELDEIHMNKRDREYPNFAP